MTDAATRPPGFGAVVHQPAFLVLFLCEVQSVFGDQLARVALSVLVFEVTGSVGATALTYAATYLPAILGGILLAGFGDRYSRRALMVAVDLLRAGLFVAMAIPSLPTLVVGALLVVAVYLGPAFSAAEVSYLAGALSPELFRVGTGLRMLTNQATQVLGFAAGGLLVSVMGPRPVLLVNAGTFVLSAVVIGTTLRGPDGDRPATEFGEPLGVRGGLRGLLLNDRHLLGLVALSSLAGLFIVPEGLAIPFAAQIGTGTAEAGLLMAAIPLGSVVGVYLLIRRVQVERRMTTARRMALVCGLPLAVGFASPPWWLALLCWFASGALAAYQVEVMTLLVQATPDEIRARFIGFFNSVLLGAQGVGVIVFGGVAQAADAGPAIGVAGVVGVVLAAVLVRGALRTQPQLAGRHRAGGPPSAEQHSYEGSSAEFGAAVPSPVVEIPGATRGGLQH